MSSFTIRHAQAEDIPALLGIYNHYVLNTPITFDIEPRTLEQRMAWFAGFQTSGPYQCLVGVKGGVPIGWASASRFKEKAAYDSSIETSVYLAPGEGGQGHGRALYAALFEAVSANGIHRAFGGITLPNAASVALHQAMGFAHAGIYPEIGRKFGKFWDVALYLRAMG